MAAFDRTKTTAPPLPCARCGSEDDSMIELVAEGARKARTYFCTIRSHEWTVTLEPVGHFESIEQLVQRTGLRRDELAILADIGALHTFTYDRRSALWQVERAVRRAGEPFREVKTSVERPTACPMLKASAQGDPAPQTGLPETIRHSLLRGSPLIAGMVTVSRPHPRCRR